MHPLMLLGIGVTIVIGGVLFFRLHAFLALILAALVISVLTPSAAVRHYEIGARAVHYQPPANKADDNTDNHPDEWVLDLKPSVTAYAGAEYLVLREGAAGELREVGRLKITRFENRPDAKGKQRPFALAAATEGGAMEGGAMEGGAMEGGAQPRDIVVLPADVAAAEKIADWNVGRRVAETFGSTCTKIAILIAMASIIGKCLLESGAADKIVRSSVRLVGERGAPLAFLGSGFLLAIPVFFDTVFYLLMPLGKAMYLRTGKNYLLYVLTIIVGGTMAHSLVPPTPGPLFVAEALNVDLGVMILGGCFVGLFTSTAGYIYAQVLNRFWSLPLRDSADISVDDLKTIMQRDDAALPPLWLSLLPILLPVVLIGGHTVLKSLTASGMVALPPMALEITETLGDKNIALVLSAAIAIGILVWIKRTSRKELAESVRAAIASGGVIILITAAGGAFGGVLKQTGIAGLVSELPTTSVAMVIVLAFLLTAAVRSAQGSSTVAMITAVGILAPIAASGELHCHPVYLALAIGCGSKPIAWMNDSGFWVICTMSGMTESEGLRAITPLSILMGCTGLAVVLAGAIYFPMI